MWGDFAPSELSFHPSSVMWVDIYPLDLTLSKFWNQFFGLRQKFGLTFTI